MFPLMEGKNIEVFMWLEPQLIVRLREVSESGCIISLLIVSSPDSPKGRETRKGGKHIHGIRDSRQPNQQRLRSGHQSADIPAWKAARNQILHGAVSLSFLHHPQRH